MEETSLRGMPVSAEMEVSCLEELAARVLPTCSPRTLELDSRKESRLEVEATMHRRRGFELASYATPSIGWRTMASGEEVLVDPALQTPWLQSLRIFMQHLCPGDALVAEYDCLPIDNGGITLTGCLSVESDRPDALAELEQELAICLGALSEHFAFTRMADEDSKAGEPVCWGPADCIRPRSVGCDRPAAPIGFSVPEEKTGDLRLPLRNAEGGGQGLPWQQGLRAVFKATRALVSPVRFQIRLQRARLDRGVRDQIERRLNSQVGDRAGSDQAERAYPDMLNAQLKAWLQASAEAVRVTVRAHTVAGEKVSPSLLRILGEEIFPGLELEVLGANAVGVGKADDGVVDLADVFPLADGLPPLLPRPAVLGDLGFPRHFANPSVQLPAEGLRLGSAQIGGFEYPVHMTQADRSRHMYVLGATGTGKSTLLYNLIRQDMEAGHGLAMVDPHGDLFEQVLAAVPPERLDDVIIIDPEDDALMVGLNPFDFGAARDVLRVNRVINDLLDIFEELYDMKSVGGPGFEQYFRNSCLLASTADPDNPQAGLPRGAPTLLTVLEVLRDKSFREHLLEHCSNSFLGADVGGEVRGFFKSAQATTGEHQFINWVPYVTNKLTRFTNNPLLRRMLCSPVRTLNFRQVMDERRILLVKLNKGRLGEQDTRMLGMLITKYLFQAALSRSDVSPTARTPFYYYLDEFQNFLTPDVPELLAEARKFALHLVLAHQTLAQLKTRHSGKVMEAILGNVATKLVFRVGVEDAGALAPAFLPHFNAETMMHLPDRQVLARMLIDNRPSPSFVFRTLAASQPAGDLDMATLVRDYLAAWQEIHAKEANRAANLKRSASIQTSGTDPSRPESGNTTTIAPTAMRGLISIREAADEAGALRDLNATLDRALLSWNSHPLTTERVAPELGRFFWTVNQSLVLVCGMEKSRGHVIVLSGRQDVLDVCGSGVGDFYPVAANGSEVDGLFCDTLFGMGLVSAADIHFVDDGMFERATPTDGMWLGQTMETGLAPCKASTGFFRTYNGSLVFVFPSRTQGLWRAAVCRGGHQISAQLGQKPGERYPLCAEGRYSLKWEKAREMPKVQLVSVAGMSLARPEPLVGTVPWVTSIETIVEAEVHV